MVSFLYKLRLISYIIGSFKDIIVKLFFLTIYLYTVSIVLMLLTHGFSHEVEFGLRSALFRLYEYFKWLYNNKDNIDWGIYFRTFVAFFLPNFFYKFLNSSLIPITKRWIARKLKSFMGRKDRNEGEDNSNKKQSHGYGRDVEAVNLIKRVLMKDIERIIDKRLFEIFLARRGKKN